MEFSRVYTVCQCFIFLVITVLGNDRIAPNRPQRIEFHANDQLEVMNETGSGTELTGFLKIDRLFSVNGSTECHYEMDLGLLQQNQTLRDECCQEVHGVFRYYWFLSMIKLGDLLRALKMWRCSQFKQECRNPSFGYTEYTRLVYARFCNERLFMNQCEEDLRGVLLTGAYKSYESSEKVDEGSGHEFYADGSKNISKIVHANLHQENVRHDLEFDQLLKPCVQAALVNVEKVTSGKYFEVKENEIAFCDIVWCAFPADTFKTNVITDTTCMPKRCIINIYILMTAAGLLGLSIVICNATVLIVFATNKRLMNSQGIYKMSLAAADLLVGVIVFPTIIDTIRRAFMSRYELVRSEVDEYSWNSGRNGTRIHMNAFNTEFLSVAGFFTSLSLTVSVYTLMVASFDRLLVVYRPLEYNQFRARSLAKKCCVFLWILGIAFSSVPLFVDDMHYTRVASVLVSLGGGDVSLIIYAVALLLPLVLVWAVNIATFAYSKKNAKVRPKVRYNSSSEPIGKSINLENQLAKTLSTMVGVFSLCIFPVAGVIVSELFIPGIMYHYPEKLNKKTATLMLSLESIAAFILMSNSLWNFFIYNARSQEFRAACRSLFGRCCQKVGGSPCFRNRGTTYSRDQHTHQSTSLTGKQRTISTRVPRSADTV